MAKSQVKSKRKANKEQNDINKQRDEFRLLAGEWYTGHPVVPASLMNAQDHEKWQQQLDEYVDYFIDALRAGTVDKEYIDRIPPELRRELADTIKQSVPGASSDTKKKERKTKKIEKAPDTTKPVNEKGQTEAAPSQETETPTNAEGEKEPVEEKSRFEKIKSSMGRVRAGFTNLGKMAMAGTKTAVLTQSPFLRNTLLAVESARTAFSKQNTSGEAPKTTGLVKQTFENLFNGKSEKKTVEPKSGNSDSIKAAKSAEGESESNQGEIVDLLKKIEENTRAGDGKGPEKEKKKSPLESLIENAKKLLQGMVAGLSSLLGSLKGVIGAAITGIKNALSSAGSALKKAFSPKSKTAPANGKPKLDKALPPRDPKTGRFMKKEDAAKLEKPKVKELPPRDPKTGRFTKAPPKPTSVVEKAVTGAKSAGVAAKGAKFVPGLSTAVALGTAGMEAYEAKSSYDAGDITEKERNEKYGEAGGGASGAIAGAALGAAAGSFIPVVGTAIGGIAGGVAGYMGGSKAGGWLGGMFGSDKKKAEVEAAKAQPAAALQVVPKLEQASSIISNTPEKPSAIEEAVAQTNDSVQKLATTFAHQVNNKSNVATQSNTTVVSMRNSARDHDSTFRRYLTDRTVFA